jgi:hypothetical protein
MPSKLSLLFDMTTAPGNLSDASPHTAGWSEVIFQNIGDFSQTGHIQTLAMFRAGVLPQQAKIIGYRDYSFTIVQGKIVTGGTRSGVLDYTGSNLWQTDVPQMSLLLRARSNGKANTRKFSIRCIPDVQVTGGEYQPTNPFKNALASYVADLSSGFWCFAGARLTDAPLRIVSIVGQTITFTGVAIGGVPGQWVRLLKVKDLAGKSLTGSYLITGGGAQTFIVSGLNNPNGVGRSGLARIDNIDLLTINSVDVSRVSQRKVGSPFERYRGRRSKRR